MYNETKWLNDFNNILKKKTKKGYSDWRKGILLALENYSIEELSDLKKKAEIKSELLSDKTEFSISHTFQQILTTATVILPLIGAIILTMANTLLSVYDFEMSQEQSISFARIVEHLTLPFGTELISILIFFIVVCLVLWIAALGYDNHKRNLSNQTKCYYKELLEIIGEAVLQKSNNQTTNTNND